MPSSQSIPPRRRPLSFMLVALAATAQLQPSFAADEIALAEPSVVVSASDDDETAITTQPAADHAGGKPVADKPAPVQLDEALPKPTSPSTNLDPDADDGPASIDPSVPSLADNQLLFSAESEKEAAIMSPSDLVVTTESVATDSNSNESREELEPTRPTLVVPAKTAGHRKEIKSTLQMKPVAGPLFGRSNRKPLIQFLSPQAKREQDAAKKTPGPPLPHPKPLSHPQIVQQNQRAQQQYAAVVQQQLRAARERAALEQAEKQRIAEQKAAEAHDRAFSSQGWVKRDTAVNQPNNTSAKPNSSQALRDPAPAVAAPAVEAEPPARSTPILVRPNAPTLNPAQLNATASPQRAPSISKSSKPVPAADVAKRPIKPKRESNPSDQSALRELIAKESLATRSQTDPDRKTSQLPPATQERRPVRARSPEVSIARRQTSAPVVDSPVADSRVGDINPSYPREEPPQLDYVGLPAKRVQIAPHVAGMKPGIERVLQYFYDHPEVADGRSNWGMMHAIMVYGIDTQLTAGGRSYSTIAWIAGNNICRGQRLLTHDHTGIKVKSGVGLQGHQAQMLAVFSLCDVPANYPLYAGNTQYSMQDVIEKEKLACKEGEELTFSLIGLSHYLDTDATWVAADGQQWNFERLIRSELAQPIVGTACGGTHRLMGFAHALRKRRAEGKPITGQWARAEYFVRDFVNYTYQLQNRDGSMSTDWFESRQDNGDLDRKIQTTGHMVEFLLTVTPDSQLHDPRLVRAIRYLMYAMHNDLGREWSIGPKGHALRSLAMFHERVYKSGPAWRRRNVAGTSNGQYYR